MRPPKPFGNQPVTVNAEKMSVWFHRLLAILLAAAFGLALAAVCLPWELPGKHGWPEALLDFAGDGGHNHRARAAIAARKCFARRVRHRRSRAARRSRSGATTGIPFGPFTFGFEAGPKLFKTLPWAMPLIWVAVILIRAAWRG